MFHPTQTSQLKYTARSGTFSQNAQNAMQDTTRTNQASDITQKLMSDYLT
jgi:t-SNARE complex subunit (syntaxin)